MRHGGGATVLVQPWPSLGLGIRLRACLGDRDRDRRGSPVL